ncbi:MULTISPECIES: glutathione S-transferase family protein [Kordiimonas]|uniref:glutathione S-transferase family protein n=1 Tax=Kordiimonas TaxID=288021 RepID=UPI00257C3FEB|nr:glutathione S-transferase family protein [Kordiimonas sp. UBA4487]
MTKAVKPILYGALGGGSAIVEAVLTLAGEPYDMATMEWGEFDQADDAFSKINPMREIPALKLADGTVLTESAAIGLWAADRHPESGLAPLPDAPERASFLRWLVWLVASIYPTFTYGDHPERYIAETAGAKALRQATDDRRQALWHHMEASLPFAPWAMGSQMTLIDIYIAAMTRWRPRRTWFKENCPKLYAVAERVDALPTLEDVWQKNFGA